MKTKLENQVGEWLRKRGLKLAIAESCTGGLIGDRITNIAGSSDYYLGSVTAYAYESKERLLGVSREILAQYGAVSSETVIEMAKGVRQALSADFPLETIVGLSVSGIAGPGGGMPGKPVGLVWVGLSTPEGNYAWQYLWHGDRIRNKEQSADAALQQLLKYLRKTRPGELSQSQRQTRNILILTADSGFGHRSAANAVAAALDEKYGSQCHVEIINPLDDKRTPALLRDSQTDYDRLVREMPDLYRFGYETSDDRITNVLVESALTVLLFEVLSGIIKKYKPDSILTTYPLYQAPLASIASINRYKTPILTVITDLSSIHRIWFHNSVEACLVPNEVVRELAINNGITPDKVWITGIPVHPDTVHEKRTPAQIRADLNWLVELPTFLAVGSRRVEQLIPALETLNHYGAPLQLVAVAGKDEELFKQLKSIEWHIPAQLFEYTDQMPVFMHAADALICKAGGLIVTEGLACGLPMMLLEAIPGQETGNADYVIQNGAGVMAQDPLAVLAALSHWMMDGQKLLKEQAVNARRLGKPQAAYDVADMTWEAALRGPSKQQGQRIVGRHNLIDLLRRNQVRWEENLLRSRK